MNFAEKKEYFIAKQKEIVELNAKLDNLKEIYKAELKAWLGVTDGEPINVLEVADLIRKVKDME